MGLPKIDQEIAALIPGFLDRREQDAQLMRTLLSQKDFGAIAAVAHKLKGNGSAFGFPMISEVGSLLERAAKAQDFNATLASLADYEDILDGIRHEFRH